MRSDVSDAQLAQILALIDGVQPVEYILEGAVTTIGRHPTCQVVVSDPTHVVSRLHARIECDGPHYTLHDNGSANGTYVNGRRINGPHLLTHNDRIGLGSATAVFCFSDPDRTVPSETSLRYDERVMVFYFKQKRLDLTPAQFRLLSPLYTHAGDVCTRESCAQVLWQREYDSDVDSVALDQSIHSLRNALRLIDKNANLIETRRGLGYMLVL
jgi:pSer/pThr/pTyr-binding forkhead associated (FHA) protein